MNILKLRETVTVPGRDVWGRESWIRFSATDKPGWWWKRPDRKLVQINFDIVKTMPRRIVLESNDYTFHIIEHVIGLSALGLDGVVIECENFKGFRSGCWPPTDGGAKLYWDDIKDHVVRTNETVVYKTLQESIKWKSGDRSVTIEPTEYDGIEVWIHVDYPGIDACDFLLRLPEDLDTFEKKLIPSKSQGVLVSIFGWIPSWRAMYTLIWLLNRIHHLLAPRVEVMAWPHLMGANAPLRFAHHRAYDAVAAIMLMGMVSCRLLSKKGGHHGDAIVGKKGSEKLE